MRLTLCGTSPGVGRELVAIFDAIKRAASQASQAKKGSCPGTQLDELFRLDMVTGTNGQSRKRVITSSAGGNLLEEFRMHRE
jgi:hypothetical protein